MPPVHTHALKLIIKKIMKEYEKNKEQIESNKEKREH